MSMGPLGIIGSTAGSPAAQSQGADVSRTHQETASQARETRMSEKAEQAAGVGQTEQHEEANDRDADGRRPWERASASSADQPSDAETAPDESPRNGQDPSGVTGRHLDVSG